MSSTGSPTSTIHHSPTMETTVVQSGLHSQHRRAASTGGGRAWSDEEEAYLIETRMHKMPYKHIAAHLQKTELACRLHYHQLSFGTKRRRRTLSVSSTKSVQQATSLYQVREPLRASMPAISPPHSPRSHASQHSRASSVYEPINILPKPSAMSRPLAPSSQPLQLITEDIERFKQQSRVDKHRLDRIYEAHRCHFWSMVAADYGDDVAPSVLEDTWISSLRNLSDSQQSTASSYHSYPPTPPNCSPQSLLATTTAGPLHSALGITMEGNESSNPMGLGFRPINFSRSVLAQQSGPRKGSFAIASILNEEDEAPRTSPIREEI